MFLLLVNGLIDPLLAECSQLDYWMIKLVLEARERNDEPSPPDTLYSIFAGLMRYMQQVRPELNLFQSSVFTGFQRTLDTEMKQLRIGLEVKKKQAEPITMEEENFL